MNVRLELETTAARAVGALSRAVGRGGGTTLPGKLLWKIDPSAVDALSSRLPAGVALVSATNGKTTTTAMVAEILRARHELAWNRSGANLLSGIASALVVGRRADFGLFEVDEGALPEALERTRPAAVLLGNLFRDQLDRYGELEIVAERWRAAVARLPEPTTVVVNADDSIVADLASESPRAVRFGLDDPRHARAGLQHAADSKYCVRCGTPYTFAVVYVGHLGDYQCPSCGHRRPELDVAARDIELEGLVASRFRITAPQGGSRCDSPCPASTTSTTPSPRRALAGRRASLEDVRAGLERFNAAFGRFERIATGGKSVVLLLVKNPAGANEVVRTLETGVPPVLVIALNDAIADGQDVSWIWDVDFEPLLARTGRVIVTGDRAAELGLRLVYGGLRRGSAGGRAVARAGARPRPGARRGRRRAGGAPDLYRDARAPCNPRRARRRAPYWKEAQS